ncbi:radical SAM protein [Sphaerisporangium melleum]|uniref:Radical SAM protein n=1 Tax=Sphaerisporangium melleum TaxID=321316 RepID=A0A917R7V6_9ACTN|nr:FxsB family cyclophane-forming radical SAM/SPASM peptide maturase [Sphaerisporangium melleum]GGK94225.1 radical SAM protein [Sphaerisporangium melleum]GII73218.1 radical SAM protein [Sphaerisporangium melleum]
MLFAAPESFRTFVLKVHARCDLACDYCYVYQAADQSWRTRPPMMTAEVASLAAARIAEHAAAHGLAAVDVVLHGGEPLLCGPRHLRRLADVLTEPPVRVRLAVQTNGVRLDEEYLDLFDEIGATVAVSLDGDARHHDAHRRTRAGRGSHARVTAAVRALSAREGRFGGLLATVDPHADPVRVYEELISYRPPVIDFLLPHGTWSTPPPGRVEAEAATPYADWLIAAFDRWYGAPVRETSVRLFDAIIHLLLGGRAGTEGVGPVPAPVVIVESDGSIEQTDALKAAYDGAAATGAHVATHSFDEVLRLPGLAATRPPCDRCRRCPVFRVCGGGHPAHRYRRGTGFANPSVYCPDLLRLITHIDGRVADDLARLRA